MNDKLKSPIYCFVVEITCPVESILNGHTSLTGPITYNTVITYSCSDGFILVDGTSGDIISEESSVRTCQENGQLTGNMPHCARKL